MKCLLAAVALQDTILQILSERGCMVQGWQCGIRRRQEFSVRNENLSNRKHITIHVEDSVWATDLKTFFHLLG